MKDQKFNAKKFLKGIKGKLGKHAPVEDDTREDDLDSLNEEEPQDDGKSKKAKSKSKRHE